MAQAKCRKKILRRCLQDLYGSLAPPRGCGRYYMFCFVDFSSDPLDLWHWALGRGTGSRLSLCCFTVTLVPHFPVYNVSHHRGGRKWEGLSCLPAVWFTPVVLDRLCEEPLAQAVRSFWGCCYWFFMVMICLCISILFIPTQRGVLLQLSSAVLICVVLLWSPRMPCDIARRSGTGTLSSR